MKHTYLLTLLTPAVFASMAGAQTTVGGPILTDTTWTLSGSPYELASPILIGQSATLTIEPGVEVHFLGGQFMSVGQGSLGPGALVAQGTPTQPITFTNPAAVEGSWDAILFPDVAIDASLDANENYISGSVMEHCIVEYAGGDNAYDGALDIYRSAPLLRNCEFRFNRQRGVDATLTSAMPPLLIEDCGFRFNSEGGLFVLNGAGNVARRCSFTDNGVSATTGLVAATHGGGAYISSTGFALQDSTFLRNSSWNYGGGAYMGAGFQADVTGCTFEENSSVRGGALALYTTSSSANVAAEVTECTFRDNSGTYGGAAYFFGSRNSILSASYFEENTAAVDGGALYFSNCTDMLAQDCSIFLNHATEEGGGAFVTSGSLTFDACTVAENIAGTDGGGLYLTSGSPTLKATTVACNTAGDGGGGLYLKSTTAQLSGNQLEDHFNVISGNLATQGSALYNDKPWNASGSGDVTIDYACWGGVDPNLDANRIWDFFDDVTLGIVLATNYASCVAPECGCYGTTYCVTSPNSVGAGSLIGYSGSTSVAANDFVLTATGASLSQPGLFFYGASQVSIPFGDGFRCVGGAIKRLPVIVSDNTGNASHAIDYAALPAAAQILSGSTWNFQYWYRDPAAGGTGFNLSNGLHVQFCQ